MLASASGLLRWPHLRIVEALLDVDHDQRGGAWQRHPALVHLGREYPQTIEENDRPRE